MSELICGSGEWNRVGVPDTFAIFLAFSFHYANSHFRAEMFCAVADVGAVIQRKSVSIANARIVLSAVAPTPLLAREASQFLTGEEPSEQRIQKAGEIASKECKPITDVRGTAELRRHLIKVLTTNAIKTAWARAGGCAV